MNYKNKIHTPAYKNLMAYRWGGKYNNGGVKKYQTAGMYGSNTVSAAGQGVGETSNIVYQESNPQVLEAKRQQMEAEKQRLINESQMTEEELKNIEAEGDVAAQEAAANVGAKGEQIASTGKEIISQADKLSDGKLGEFAKETGKKLFGKGTEATSTSLLPEGYKIGDFSKGISRPGLLGKPSTSLLSTPSPGLSLSSPGGLGSSGLLDKSSSLFKHTPSFSPTIG